MADFLSHLFCPNFDQIDGLSMGNPPAPPLAHLFMVKVEEKALNIALFRPITWLRYVDDIYARLRKRDFDRRDDVLIGLNQIHNCIELTAEPETNRTLNFLEISCTATNKRNGTYATKVYRKPINMNLYVHWDSAHPGSQKLGIFRTF